MIKQGHVKYNFIWVALLTWSEDVSKRRKGTIFGSWGESSVIHGGNLFSRLSIMNSPNNGGAISGAGLVFGRVAKKNAVAFASAFFLIF